MSTGPTKQEIEAVFNRLRLQSSNKSCFDCGTKNPTWSSVTYGIFICIDCSAVHRSLGVHLTFVRSINLDTNWTWQQLRQMQLGGNANAAQFFRQHNSNITDAQQKYNSRAAQLYKDKLSKSAINAMRVHGNKLFLDNPHEKIEIEVDKEEDFFGTCADEDDQQIDSLENNNSVLNFAEKLNVKNPIQMKESDLANVLDKTSKLSEPSVDFLSSDIPPDQQIRSTIGVRKIQPKKSGLGARKSGLGATKVKTNFAEIEQRANLANQCKDVPEKPISEKDEIETVASVRLAYKDLSIQKSKEEEKLKIVDPIKAKQMERLGMGFNVKGGISHSAISDMQTISQEASTKPTKSAFEREPPSTYDIFDDYSPPMYTSSALTSKQDKELILMGFETIEPHSNITTMFAPALPKTSSGYNETTNKQTTNKSTSSSSVTTTSAAKKNKSPNDYDNDSKAQMKFGSAKGISSDQFFDTEHTTNVDVSSNLTRFQGSNSISSSDYFASGTSSGGSSSRSTNSAAANFQAPDLDEVKESVRQGVTKVAGRLSSLANDVMSSIQDKYGY